MDCTQYPEELELLSSTDPLFKELITKHGTDLTAWPLRSLRDFYGREIFRTAQYLRSEGNPYNLEVSGKD